MRSILYVTVLGCLLSGLLAFAVVPAAAQANSDLMMMQKGGPTVQHNGPVATPGQKGFAGEAKAGSSQQTNAPSHMKTMMKGQSTGKLNQQSRAQGTAGSHPANVSAQAKGGEATIARASRSATCLRVFSKPSFSSEEMACVPRGETVHLTGVFSRDRHWAQLDSHGWVFFRDLKTNVKPPQVAANGGSWGRSAGAGKGRPRAGRHYYRGTQYCYPGYYSGYSYPGYYGWYWGPWY
ncbi:MAG: hypothetical protein WBG50_28820 [Desulfomonilaceae bacterium]